MAVTYDTPIAELKLTTQAPKTLAEHSITTVGRLLQHRRSEVAALHGMGDSRLADIDRALQLRGLWYGKPFPDLGFYTTCKRCPACPDCGMPRATSARNVVVDLRGRAKHATAVGKPCDDCDQHHRQLVTAAAAAA